MGGAVTATLVSSRALRDRVLPRPVDRRGTIRAPYGITTLERLARRRNLARLLVVAVRWQPRVATSPSSVSRRPLRL